MDEVKNKLKEVFEMALENGVLLRGVSFTITEVTIRNESDKKSFIISNIETECSLVLNS